MTGQLKQDSKRGSSSSFAECNAACKIKIIFCEIKWLERSLLMSVEFPANFWCEGEFTQVQWNFPVVIQILFSQEKVGGCLNNRIKNVDYQTEN